LWRPTGPFLVFELLLASLVVTCCLTASPVTRLLGWRPFAQVGRVSYGMYLFHVPVIGSWRRALPWLVEHPGVLFPAALLTSFAAARLSYRHIEAPLLAYKERFRPRAPQPLMSGLVAAQPAASVES
jgi:peptidoglycan/LPS O-acetylase OafA/YrhL